MGRGNATSNEDTAKRTPAHRDSALDFQIPMLKRIAPTGTKSAGKSTATCGKRKKLSTKPNAPGEPVR